MAILIEQEKVVATSQEVTFDSCTIYNRNGLVADVLFKVLNENGAVIEEILLTYEGEEFNTWWENFNSGKFLYDDLVTRKSFSVEVPESIEAEFTN